MKARAPYLRILSKLGQAMTVTGYTSAGALLTLFLVGFVPQMEGPEVRRPVTKKITELRPEDYPLPIAHNVDGSSWRGAVLMQKHEALPLQNVQATAEPSPSHWVQFSPQSVVFSTASKQYMLANTALALVLAEETFTFEDKAALVTTQPVGYGEALAHNGKPLRWQQGTPEQEVRFDLMCALERPSMEALQAKLLKRAYGPNAGESYVSMARRYQPIVSTAAQRFNLRPSLIYAIIHTESNFRPRLVSSAAAMGLMQLLPSTAGGEVHKFLHGYSTHVSHEELSRPEINIVYGAAYFHLLMTRHLYGITDLKSREYCAIAAYNMGIGRLIRYFGGSNEVAFATINAMSPRDVYKALTQALPIAETRAYVTRVHQRENFYTSM